MCPRKAFGEKHINLTKQVVLKCVSGFQRKIIGIFRNFTARLSKLRSMCTGAHFEGKQVLEDTIFTDLLEFLANKFSARLSKLHSMVF